MGESCTNCGEDIEEYEAEDGWCWKCRAYTESPEPEALDYRDRISARKRARRGGKA